GGMGEVYRAQDTRLDRTVALKVVHSQFSERSEREARAAAALNHPHICQIYDVGRQDGMAYLVMEYLDGEGRSARLRRGALPVEQALRHASEIASALAEAHRKGISHRDLKPANVMLTRSGAKLLDFGLAASPAAFSDEATVGESAGPLGTLPYM